MNQCDRIRQILKENKLKQCQFASAFGVTESYICKLLKDPNVKLSQTIAFLIEEKYGYNAKWILTGTEPKLKQFNKNHSLSEIHLRTIAQIVNLSNEQVKAVLAFINFLNDINTNEKGN